MDVLQMSSKMDADRLPNFVDCSRMLAIRHECGEERRCEVSDAKYESINQVADEMYRIAHQLGFHANEVQGEIPTNFGAWCANLHSEVSELWEAYRKGQLNTECDKHNGMTCAEEELADIVIRAMDTAVGIGVNLGESIRRKAEYNVSRPFRNGGKLA